MSFNIAAASDILKTKYLGPIREILNNKVVLLNQIEENTEDFYGSQAYIPLHVGRNEGQGTRTEDQDLPVAQSQKYDKALFNMSYHYGSIRITGPVIAKMEKDEGAFTQAIDSEVRGLTRDMKNDLNRQLYTPNTGELAGWISGASTTIVVTSAQYLRKDMLVDHVNRSTGAIIQSGLSIVSVNRTTNTVVISAALTSPASTSMLVRTGVVGAGGTVPTELFGLADIISNVDPVSSAWAGGFDFGLIDRTTNDFWRANVLANGGVPRAVNLDLLQSAIDLSDIEGDGEIDMFLMDHTQHARIAKLLLPDRRFSSADGKPRDYDGGYGGITYNDIPLLKDKHAPKGKIWCLPLSTFIYFKMSDYDWMDKDGAILNRVNNRDAYTGTLRAYHQLANSDPKDSVQIADLVG